MKAPDWKPLEASVLRERLEEVKALLLQAAAVGVAQDAERLEKLMELEQRTREDARGRVQRRRYR
ncbi:hypothetical protein HRD49_30555 [Corallococcus exiguus]|uniref:Uncharacterized protein n=1 Tax=Corallococcus exiguus TaxID=83462 RepID=A0A7Y1RYT8_9BACT|nr:MULTISPECIES: hypothetical protein [Corallococcus]MBN8471364.1 hypothetical protein [Corallococcus exiguus]NBC39726.1 hypothetical protein [Corallococcus exiguus]NNB84711.1 hypothetical protein [Corallococcus exiguus]NNB92596.1 hypothetical protein [Corallococcus exiguus]NNC02969.1 hypothetical protein [Corallococcus exiguus]